MKVDKRELKSIWSRLKILLIQIQDMKDEIYNLEELLYNITHKGDGRND